MSDAGAEARRPSAGALRGLNAAVGLVHAAQAVVVLLLANDFAIAVTARFQDGPPGTEAGAAQDLLDVRFAPAVALFLGLAAVDHLLMAAPGVQGWYERGLARGINVARWTEYSVSASLMIVLIGLLTGITDVAAVVAIFGVNAAMILFGLAMERSNPIDRRRTDWAPFWFGCVAGAVPWVAIAIMVIGAEVESGGVPAFVLAIFVSLFVLFNSFAVNMFLQYRRIGPWRDYRFGEVAYITLSLIAKSALAWQVYAGALAS